MSAAGTNVLWKTPIPGLGLSSPVVWGDEVFVSTSISGQKDAGLKVGSLRRYRAGARTTPTHEWRIYALDKKTGKIKWQQTVHKAVPKIKRHTKATPREFDARHRRRAADRVLRIRRAVCLRPDGQAAVEEGSRRARRGLLHRCPDAQWETGSSPVLHDGMVIVLADVQKDSFLAAFDATTGKEIWRTPRNDVPTWGTPTIHRVNGQTQIIVNGFRHAGAYDFKTGKEIWKLAGNGDIPVPTPVVQRRPHLHHQRSRPAVARLRDQGDRDRGHHPPGGCHDATTMSPGASPRGGGYMCTPLVYRGLVYIVTLQRRAERLRRQDRRAEISGSGCSRTRARPSPRRRSRTTARSTSRAKTDR